ncbi:MAG: hypothetical protein AAB074_11930 [Planctomycetota bacterium]
MAYQDWTLDLFFPLEPVPIRYSGDAKPQALYSGLRSEIMHG